MEHFRLSDGRKVYFKPVMGLARWLTDFAADPSNNSFGDHTDSGLCAWLRNGKPTISCWRDGVPNSKRDYHFPSPEDLTALADHVFSFRFVAGVPVRTSRTPAHIARILEQTAWVETRLRFACPVDTFTVRIGANTSEIVQGTKSHTVNTDKLKAWCRSDQAVEGLRTSTELRDEIEAQFARIAASEAKAPEICGVGLPSVASRAIPEIAELAYRAIRQPETTSTLRLGDETIKIFTASDGDMGVAVGDTIRYVDIFDLLKWCREHTRPADYPAVHTIAGVPVEAYMTAGDIEAKVSQSLDNSTIVVGDVTLIRGITSSGETRWHVYQDGQNLGQVPDAELRQLAGLKNIAGVWVRTRHDLAWVARQLPLDSGRLGFDVTFDNFTIERTDDGVQIRVFGVGDFEVSDLDLRRWQREVAQTEEPPKQVDLAATQGHNGLAKGTNMSIWQEFLGEMKAGAAQGLTDAGVEGFSEIMKRGMVRAGLPEAVVDHPMIDVLVQLGGPQACLLAVNALPENMQSQLLVDILKGARSSGTRTVMRGAAKAAIDSVILPMFSEMLALGAPKEPEGELPTVTQVEAD